MHQFPKQQNIQSKKGFYFSFNDLQTLATNYTAYTKLVHISSFNIVKLFDTKSACCSSHYLDISKIYPSQVSYTLSKEYSGLQASKNFTETDTCELSNQGQQYFEFISLLTILEELNLFPRCINRVSSLTSFQSLKTENKVYNRAVL